MNSSFQLLKGETDGGKYQSPQLNANHFSKENLPHHIQKKENQRFNTHWRTIHTLNLVCVQVTQHSITCGCYHKF